jgi:PilZ domain-containing protein
MIGIPGGAGMSHDDGSPQQGRLEGPVRGRNRRRVERRSVPGIEATLNAPGDVRVLDLAIYGMAIEAPADLEVGKKVFLEVRHGKHRANVEVAVRWRTVSRVQRTERSLVPVSRAGVEFVDIFREDEGGIWDWIMVPEPAAP